MNAILSFWLAYILTRPLGASIGDYLASPKEEGGLGLGTNLTSFIFLGTILALVAYLAISKRDVIASGAAGARPEPSTDGEARVLVVTNKTDATPAVVEAVRERAIAGPASFFVWTRRSRGSRSRPGARSPGVSQSVPTPTTTSSRS
jgi:hypothetical protein